MSTFGIFIGLLAGAMTAALLLLVRQLRRQAGRIRILQSELERLRGLEKAMGDTLAQTRKAQAALDRTQHLTALGELAGGIAHEINNPLSVIMGRASVLVRKVQSGNIDSAALLGGLDQIVRTVTRIARIVDSIRRLARSDVTANDIRPDTLATVLHETVEFTDDKMKRQGIQFSIHDPLALSEAQVLLRGFGLSQILINLIINAIDALEEKPHSDRWIRLELGRKGETSIQIRVVDSGQGIPLDMRDRIMEPYFTTKPAGKGTGLGLSLSQKIAEEHGGRITLDGDATHTTFVVELPEWKQMAA